MTTTVILCLAWIQLFILVASYFFSFQHIKNPYIPEYKENKPMLESIWSLLLLYIVIGLEVFNLSQFYIVAKAVDPEIIFIRDVNFIILVLLCCTRLIIYEVVAEWSEQWYNFYQTVSIASISWVFITFMIKPVTYIIIYN